MQKQLRLWKQTLLGLTLLSLMMSSTACASKQVRTVVATPPISLLGDCVETAMEMRTNGDLILKIRKLREDLALCTADKRAIRLWAKEAS